MKASDLIATLGALVDIHGDQDVFITGPEAETVEIEGVVICKNEDDSFAGFMFADEETYLAFADSSDE
jgi:hypothetical protein